ncbi:amidase [Sneathiella chinensis]|uniref:Amidase n=1 Tax=Sneathiella chinensis TaxID=349750 RepID=A0ABQ5U0A0_9PROT|nr:amidase family protein [Sneathiella chinensis]GLQ05258.1 amidase [Sneathiella chinensis]
MNELIKLTAVEAVEKLKAGEVSPLELIDASEARILETDDAVNALPIRCFDRAREHAGRLMKETAPEGGAPYLYGLPIAIKDLTPVKGVRFTLGSPIFADQVAARSDIMVERLEARGGIVVAKANTPEFGAGAQTFNEVLGTTTNPWDTRMTPGGSSGGSAAALAAGQVWLAQGSDLGGSLRIPASFTGTVGLRPSPGRVASGPGLLPFGLNSVEGPMGRTVADVALMLDMMAGEHVADPISLPAPAVPYSDCLTQTPNFGKVAYSPNLGQCPIDGEVAAICAEAAKSFAAFTGGVEEDCFDLTGGDFIFQTLRAAQFAAAHAEKLKTHRNQLKPDVIWNIEAGLKLTAEDIGRAQREQGALYGRVADFFGSYDLLIAPTVMVPPFDHTIRSLTEVEGVKFDNYVAWLAMTYLLTITGCPVISVPCGFTRSGLPVGLQIMAPPHREDRVLQAAHAFEQAHDFAARVPVDPISGK